MHWRARAILIWVTAASGAGAIGCTPSDTSPTDGRALDGSSDVASDAIGDGDSAAGRHHGDSSLDAEGGVADVGLGTDGDGVSDGPDTAFDAETDSGESGTPPNVDAARDGASPEVDATSDAPDGGSPDLDAASDSAPGDASANLDAASESAPDASVTDLDAEVDGAAALDGEGGNDGSTPFIAACGATRPPADPSVLVDLGAPHGGVASTFGSNVLASDGTRWVLWSAATGQQIANGVPAVQAAAGSVFLAGTELRSLADGTLLGSVPPGTLSHDGSYIWQAGTNGVTAWSLAGTVLLSQTGSYPAATGPKSTSYAGQHVDQYQIVANPAGLRIAFGPGGANAVETISIATGTDVVMPFFGTFLTWSLDGQNFFTAEPVNGTTYQKVRIYDSSATLLATDILSGIADIQGMDGYYWTSAGALVSAADARYLGAIAPAHGSALPNFATNTVVFPGVGLNEENYYKILSFSGSLSQTTFSVPADVVTRIGGPTFELVYQTATDWTVQGGNGLIYNSATSRYIGCGAVTALASGGADSGALAVATASGVLVLDTERRTLVQQLDAQADAVAVSAAGNVLTAGGGLYFLPSSSPVVAPSFSGGAFSAISSNGARVAWKSCPDRTMCASCSRAVVDVSGGSVGAAVFRDTGHCPDARLSPSGALIAVTDTGPQASSTTLIYNGSTYVTAVPGFAVGWIDDNRLLVQTYTDNQAYPLGPVTEQLKGTTIYDGEGRVLSTPPLPVVGPFQDITATILFDTSSWNLIYLSSPSPVPPTLISSIGAVIPGYLVGTWNGPPWAVSVLRTPIPTSM